MLTIEQTIQFSTGLFLYVLSAIGIPYRALIHDVAMAHLWRKGAKMVGFMVLCSFCLDAKRTKKIKRNQSIRVPS